MPEEIKEEANKPEDSVTNEEDKKDIDEDTQLKSKDTEKDITNSSRDVAKESDIKTFEDETESKADPKDKTSEPVLPLESKSPAMIIVVDSLGKAGSTTTSKILSSCYLETFSIIEPIKLFEKKELPITTDVSVSLLKDALSCNIGEIYRRFGNDLFETLIDVDHKCSSDSSCLTNKCIAADARLLKVKVTCV